mmetsp:Transcript_36600/g.85543  ORF Transcript_36600/g.85543 Transcript_36600/m.85543 type:complete len:337 (-) Transcript_36600:414-1424(-)
MDQIKKEVNSLAVKRKKGIGGRRHNRLTADVVDLEHEERTVVVLYNKPVGVITSHSNADALPGGSTTGRRTTVYEDVLSMRGYIPSNYVSGKNNTPLTFDEATGINIHSGSKLHAVGRLDVNTTGVLLLTNDGGLVHRVTNPSSGWEKIGKTYQALIMGWHSMDDVCGALTQMAKNGVDIGAKYGGMTAPPDHVRVLSHPTPKTTWVEITISEGRNRQVRRMFHSIGSGVIRLHRCRIGEELDLQLLDNRCKKKEEVREESFARNDFDFEKQERNDKMRPGSWRVLSDLEVQDKLGWDVRRISIPFQPTRKKSSPTDSQNINKKAHAVRRERKENN